MRAAPDETPPPGAPGAAGSRGVRTRSEDLEAGNYTVIDNSDSRRALVSQSDAHPARLSGLTGLARRKLE